MRYRHFVATCLLAGLGFAPVRAGSAVPVEGLYEGAVAGEATETGRAAAAADALRQVVVRVSGRSVAAKDPALQSLYGDAAKYVQTFRSVAPGQVAVSFDPNLVEEALAKAGQPLWGRERPQVLVVLDGPAAAQAGVRRDLLVAAQLRGIPCTFPETKTEPPMDVREGKPEALQAVAKAFGADALLVLHFGGTVVSGDWHGPGGDGTAIGAITDVMQVMADRLGSALALPAGESGKVSVVVHGVSDLKAFVSALSQLANLPSVRGVSVEGVTASTLKVRVSGAMDADGLRKVVGDLGHFEVAASGGLREVDVVYRP